MAELLWTSVDYHASLPSPACARCPGTAGTRSTDHDRISGCSCGGDTQVDAAFLNLVRTNLSSPEPDLLPTPGLVGASHLIVGKALKFMAQRLLQQIQDNSWSTCLLHEFPHARPNSRPTRHRQNGRVGTRLPRSLRSKYHKQVGTQNLAQLASVL